MKLIALLKEHGFTVMIVGFLLALFGLITYMRTRMLGTYVPSVAMGVTISGFVVYVAGRILVEMRKSASAKRVASDEEKEKL